MSIGTALAEGRREAGLSVSRVSRITRVRETVIHAIERDDFSLCGGDFYARGHIRTLATVAGLDAAQLVREYDERYGGASPVVSASGVFTAARDIRLRDGRLPGWVAAVAVAVLVLAVFGVVRLLGGDPEDVGGVGEGPQTIITPTPAGTLGPLPGPERRRQSAPERGGTAGGKDAGKDADKAKQVTVRVAVQKPSWLHLRDAKGRRLFRGTLTAGNHRTWKAPKKIQAVIGDAAAVRLTVNGKRLGTLGRTDGVVRKTFRPRPD